MTSFLPCPWKELPPSPRVSKTVAVRKTPPRCPPRPAAVALPTTVCPVCTVWGAASPTQPPCGTVRPAKHGPNPPPSFPQGSPGLDVLTGHRTPLQSLVQPSEPDAARPNGGPEAGRKIGRGVAMQTDAMSPPPPVSAIPPTSQLNLLHHSTLGPGAVIWPTFSSTRNSLSSTPPSA